MYHIVTPIPFLLDYSFYAPILLRLVLGIYILAIGFSAKHKSLIVQNTPQSRRELTGWEIAYRTLFIICGLALIIGFYTQIASIIVIILLLAAIFDTRARITHEMNRAEMSLLLVIALSLLLTGAGPFAIDLPL